MKRNMACSLFAHERIITTVAKAKEMRPFVERLITLGKKGAAQLEIAASATGAEKVAAQANALHARRRLMQQLGGKRIVVLKSDAINIVDKLLNDLGPRYRNRPGGYTRVLKRTERRLGDAAPTAFLELLSANEGSTTAPAVAPTVAD